MISVTIIAHEDKWSSFAPRFQYLASSNAEPLVKHVVKAHRTQHLVLRIYEVSLRSVLMYLKRRRRIFLLLSTGCCVLCAFMTKPANICR